ncbi:MAG: hypothetical protein M0Z60_03360 [Nitrospiraceae bacterium]|nr:hypothetical protein [Nitrospiraceae bacterium]
MQSHIHAYIAYIVGRLIAGKKILSLYDYMGSREIEIDSLPDAEQLKEFSYVNWSYMASSPNIGRFQYSFRTGDSVDLAVKGNSFIGYIRGSSSHFIGTVRGDSVYFYDQKASAHFNYRIIGKAVDC